MKAKGCDVELSGNNPGFTLPSNIGELGDDITTLKLSSCSLRGPPLGETLQLLKPLALTLEKLDLTHNEIGGTITDDILAYGKLVELQLSYTGIGGVCCVSGCAHHTTTHKQTARASELTCDC